MGGKIKVGFMDKATFPEHSRELFAILAKNMSAIAPTGNSYEDDYKIWFEAVGEGIKKPRRQIVLARPNCGIVGFFQYYVNGDMFMMEEIQITREYQQEHDIFRKIYEFVLKTLPDSVTTVEAYANKRNEKSHGILTLLGLSVIGENKNGSCNHYRGSLSDLLGWYERKENVR